MNNKEAAIIKALAELGYTKPKELTPSEEELLTRALNPEEQFLYDVERLFSQNGK